MALQVLSNEDIQRIHEMTLELLESVGVWFHDCPEAVELFEKHGCSADGYRVQIPRQVVTDCLASVPDRNKLKLCALMLEFGEPIGLKKGEVHVGMIGNPYYLHEYGKGHRNVLESDLDEKDCVLDNLPNIEFDCCSIIPESHRQAGEESAMDETIDQCIDYLRRVVRNRPAPDFKNPPLRVSIPQGRKEFFPVNSITLMTPFQRIALLRHAIVCGPEKTEALLKQDTSFVYCLTGF
jgi:trimethylamine:corrinoid methyltransferase-like protein